MKRVLRFLLLGATSLVALRGAEWQWAAPVPPPAQTAASDEKSLAFLWIPPDCNRVRGLVFGHHNMEEQALLEHPTFRRTLAELGFAAVWVAPTFDRNFRYDQGAGERFDAMLADLAARSGYAELVAAPIVPVGHSAAASMPWYMAAWKPGRVLAGISFSGQWPYVPDEKEAPHVAGVDIDSVPGLVTLGEYEWADTRVRDGLKMRAAHPDMPLSGLGIPADGHFLMTDEKIEFISLYLKKAAAARLPAPNAAPGADALRAIDTAQTGWLVDRYRLGKDPVAPAAPVGQYRGPAAEAFWWFDEELAKAAEALQRKHRGKPALLGYVQDGAVIPQKNGTHQQVTIPFRPENDGVTFRLSATFLDRVPEGRPEKWTGQKAGEPISPPPSGGPAADIVRITGPIRHVSADVWELALDRTSILNDRRGNEAWLAAVWPGDGVLKRAMQQAKLSIPGRNNQGFRQTITFDLPPTLRLDQRQLKLSGKTDSGLIVRYFVREGPATIFNGDTLRIGEVPPRAKFPVSVTVVAWQFGRASEPRVQTAEPVARTLLITR